MTLFTTDYLEYYLTLVSWIVNNGIWAVLVSSGVFALPFVAIVIQEWLKARAEGADEAAAGSLDRPAIDSYLSAFPLAPPRPRNRFQRQFTVRGTALRRSRAPRTVIEARTEPSAHRS